MPDNQQLADIGRHITFTEERADDAENELKAVLILQMLADKVGQELDCVVTGLTNFGIFVQSRKLGIEGLVQLADLGPDQWQYNPKHGCVVGKHSGRIDLPGPADESPHRLRKCRRKTIKRHACYGCPRRRPSSSPSTAQAQGQRQTRQTRRRKIRQPPKTQKRQKKKIDTRAS